MSEREREGYTQANSHEKLGHTSTIKDQDTEINLINAFNAPKRKSSYNNLRYQIVEFSWEKATRKNYLSVLKL